MKIYKYINANLIQSIITLIILCLALKNEVYILEEQGITWILILTFFLSYKLDRYSDRLKEDCRK